MRMMYGAKRTGGQNANEERFNERRGMELGRHMG